MATITATMALNSDISDYGLTINNTMTMRKADSTLGLDQTTGLAKRTLINNNHVDLLTCGEGIALDVTADKSAKLYIKNIGTSATDFITIGIGKASTGTTEEGFDLATSAERYCSVGRLYGGDWMLTPWNADKATHGLSDITIQASNATSADPMHLEYMVFFQ
jgi:hypothetical protein